VSAAKGNLRDGALCLRGVITRRRAVGASEEADVVPLRVGVLGPVMVWRDGREVGAGQPRQLAVLGVLASHANRVVPLGQLVDAVWGDDPPATAQGGVYTYVAGLRRVLEPDRPGREPPRVLLSSGGGYLLRLEACDVDAVRFEECLSRSRGLRASGDIAAAAQSVDEALALWRGQPYTGVPGPFAEAERRRLAELRTAAAEELADLMLAQGQAAEAVPVLTALVAEHPLRERTRGLLMIALYQCGRQAEALRVFHDVRERLAEDLGIDPGTELARIHQRLLAMDPALDAPAPQPPAPQPPAPSSEPAAPSGVLLSAPVQLSAAVLPAPAEPAAAETGPVASASAPAAGAAADAAACPAQLPPEPAGFVGRGAELGWLEALLPRATPARHGASQVSPIALITGTAGVGKTTLAIRFARQVAPLFPDGQLYVDLRGFDPAGAPMPPGTALQWFFDALGVLARDVPSAIEARSALLRTLLDGKRMLLLLDNAHDADQVRPLLPGSSGCMVLVTSRSQLTGLVVAGARALPLDVLDAREAAELVAERLGAERAAAESDAVAALVEHSARLPLALSVTCARAMSRPSIKLADLAAELADARGRLDALRTGEQTTDLRAVFSWSADKLSDPAGRMFRLLSLHRGPDISAAAAASLAAVTLAEARTALAELGRASLLTEEAAGRFGCHDLLRAYAAELAAATLSEAERDLAVRRLLDHYLRAAHAAACRLYPPRDLVPLPAPLDGVTAEEFSGPGAYDAALAWFGAEQRALHNMLEQAAALGYDEHCWKLAWYWTPLLNRRGRMHEALTVMGTALLAAGRLGDRAALGHVHCDVGQASGSLGDYRGAEEHLRQALELFTELGDRACLGHVRYGLGVLLTQENRYDEALDHAAEALRLRRALDDHAAIAYSENSVGWILAHLGQPDAALWYCRRALQMHQESGSRTGIADTLDSIGYAYGQLAEHGEAAAHYEQALELYRLLGDPQGEADSRLHLGDSQLASGQHDAARRNWEQALALLAQIPGADTSKVNGRLEHERTRSIAVRLHPVASEPCHLRCCRPARPPGCPGGRGTPRGGTPGRRDEPGSLLIRWEEVLTLDTLNRALLLENIHPDATARLTKAGYQVETMKHALGEDELIEKIQGFSLLGIRSQTQVTERVLAAAPGLLAVGAFCIGTNQVDLAAAARRGVAVFNAPFSNTRSVVELAVAEIISLARRLPEKNFKMHAGEWDKSAKGAHEVRGRKLGIVGYGNIGTQLSVIAESLGMSVYFYDVADKLAIGNARRCSTLQELLESVETVTLHVDGRAGNHGFFGEEEFAMMNPRSLFLNLSRGFVVDHAALRRNIESGHIAGAAIDVFPKEPKGNGEEFVSELRGVPNVILTPHIGGSTEEAQQDIGEFVSGKLVDFADGGATAMSVNLPNVALPSVPGAHRLIHLHQNVPGVLAAINRVLADHGVNVEGQLLRTRDDLGYVITDIGTQYSDEVLSELRAMDVTIRLRTIAA
jgi:phosphoglycerate dehydrogenase-like enzyme/DNA-binding SARP family transcriptional activator/tetratricopeptide (TPR) repeat protein